MFLATIADGQTTASRGKGKSCKTQREPALRWVLIGWGLAIGLAAQCGIPPHSAQYPFEIVSQRGVSHPFALFS